ncbi:MAG: hypothetical protein JWR10_4775 [Rubritepida sp.]|nr:hypothetical protein [Rubritepida sp.]
MKFFAWFVFSRAPAACHLFEAGRATGTSRLAAVTRDPQGDRRKRPDLTQCPGLTRYPAPSRLATWKVTKAAR